MIACERIDGILESVDRAEFAGSVERAEEQRQEILRRFPRDAWADLPLERYAIGQADSSEAYGRWIEFKTPDLGSMRGGSAHKHIVYKHGTKPGWHYDESSYPSVEAAWEAVRAAFVRAFELADEGRWEEIDGIPELRSGPALLTKTLWVHFPEALLPIFSAAHLRAVLHELDRDGDTSGLGTVSLNRRLLAGLRSCPRLGDWSTKELERLVYKSELNPFEKTGATRMVKIAPGEDARLWDDCLAGSYICVGWDDIGDLGQFETIDALRTALETAYYGGNPGIAAQKARELWTLTELSAGDLVVANKGISRVLAVGTVAEEGYEWRDERPEGKHTVQVEWDTGFAKDIPPQKRWGVVTVGSVPEALRRTILEKETSPALVPELFAELREALELKKQVVLYGPPGTGKTYTARRFAVSWLQEDEAARQQVLADSAAFDRAERHLVAGAVARRIWWIVAKRAEWSWSQLFADGTVDYRRGRLQRNYPLVERGDLVVGYQATPDKRIVALARITKTIDDYPADDPGLELEPVAELADGPTYSELLEDPVLSKSEPLRHRNQGTLFRLEPNEAEHLAGLLMDRNPGLDEHFADEGGGVGRLTYVTFHPSYSYEEFVEGLRPEPGDGAAFRLTTADGVFKRICRDARLNRDARYVLMIDEINRANIAKVLGELITLLEADKRGMTVVLPQSGEQFLVPPNVYVLGTMNTADRSIRLLDVALRRRFAFLELMPDTELLRGEAVAGLQLDLLLDALNARIRQKIGREKQIGHSFFLRGGTAVDDPIEFARIFRLEVLPLLQEYAYEDYGMLAEFVGEKIVDVDGQRVRAEVVGDPEKLVEALQELVAAGDA